METQDLVMKLHNFSYQPQKLTTKFVEKWCDNILTFLLLFINISSNIKTI